MDKLWEISLCVFVAAFIVVSFAALYSVLFLGPF